MASGKTTDCVGSGSLATQNCPRACVTQSMATFAGLALSRALVGLRASCESSIFARRPGFGYPGRLFASQYCCCWRDFSKRSRRLFFNALRRGIWTSFTGALHFALYSSSSPIAYARAFVMFTRGHAWVCCLSRIPVPTRSHRAQIAFNYALGPSNSRCITAPCGLTQPVLGLGFHGRRDFLCQ